MDDSKKTMTKSRKLMTSLPGKFVLLIISILFLVLIATILLFDYQNQKFGVTSILSSNRELIHKMLYQEWKNKNRSNAELIAMKLSTLMKENNDPGIHELLKQMGGEGVVYIRVINQNDDVIYRYYKDKITEAKIHAIETGLGPDAPLVPPITSVELSSKYGLAVVSVDINYNKTHLGNLRIAYATNEIDDTLNFINSQMTIIFVDAVNSLQRWMILFLMIIFVIIVATGVYIGRDLDSSLKKLLQGAKEIGYGNLSHKLDLHSQDEMQIIADSLNTMTGELKEKIVSKSYLHNIVESIPNMMIVLSPELLIRSLNRQTLAKLQYSLAEILDQSFSSIIRIPNLEEKSINDFLVKTLMANRFVQNTALVFIKKDGGEIPVLLNASLVFDANKQLESIICVFEEIEHKK